MQQKQRERHYLNCKGTGSKRKWLEVYEKRIFITTTFLKMILQ
jgi:hypothetical protein